MIVEIWKNSHGNYAICSATKNGAKDCYYRATEDDNGFYSFECKYKIKKGKRSWNELLAEYRKYGYIM